MRIHFCKTIDQIDDRPGTLLGRHIQYIYRFPQRVDRDSIESAELDWSWVRIALQYLHGLGAIEVEGRVKVHR